MWFNDIEFEQRHSSTSHPAGGVAPTRRDLAVHAVRERQREGRAVAGRKHYEDVPPNPWLRESDAMWIRRGQHLAGMLLTSRQVAGLLWASALVLVGGSLVLLALFVLMKQV